MYTKVLCSIDGSTDENEVFEGYSDGSTWNGWNNIAFTREQVREYLTSSPYDCLIDDDFAVMYAEDGEEKIPTFKGTIDGEEVILYDMNGYCFVVLAQL